MSPSIMLACVLLTPAAGSWQEVERTDGITVLKHDQPGREMPAFRAIGEVEGDLYHVLAVITDVDRQAEWLPNTRLATVMERPGEDEVISYNVTDAPWPASDREVVVHRTVHVLEPGRVVEVRLEDVRLPAPKDVGIDTGDLVRVASLQATYRLTRIAPDRVEVDYQVDADPGGRIPEGLAARAARDLPFETLRNLRRQVQKTQGRYEAYIQRWEQKAPTGEGPPTG